MSATELAVKIKDAVLDARVAELSNRSESTLNKKWKLVFKLEDQLKAII